MQKETVDHIVDMLKYIRKHGKSIYQQDLPQVYQKYVAAATQHGFITSHKENGRFPHQVLTVVDTDKVPTHLNPFKTLDERYESLYQQFRAEAVNYPSADYIISKMDAIPKGKLNQLHKLRKDVTAYFKKTYGLKPTTKPRPVEAPIQPAAPKEKPERQPDFRFSRNDLKKTAETLPTKDYILKRIAEIPDGDIEKLITLRDKIHDYYNIKKPGL